MLPLTGRIHHIVRAFRWLQAWGSIGNWDNMFPTPFVDNHVVNYDWSLHAIYLLTLQLPDQYSLLNASLCMPLTGLTSHGPNNSYQEPNYAFTLLEPHIPLPGTTYVCSAAQQAFAYTYLVSLRGQ